MQFLEINANTKLKDVSAAVGPSATNTVLQLNSLPWSSNVGEQYNAMLNDTYMSAQPVSTDQKINLLNGLTSDSDVFESAALMGDDGWKVLNSCNTLPGYLRIPDSVSVPNSAYTLGNGQPVSNDIYSKAISGLKATGQVDPAIFNEYNSNAFASAFGQSTGGVFSSFNLPWGKISIYSSIADTSLDFPVYPEEINDETIANYEQMPDTIFQYEPWQTYKSSGPRVQSLTFKMHRDMWSGDHRDGKCQELVRFCQAQCYPRYRGAAVIVPTVTIYIEGQTYIQGVMTSVKPHWEGPIGLDGWYLVCHLELSITEVSQVPLNYDTVMNGGLIGWDK